MIIDVLADIALIYFLGRTGHKTYSALTASVFGSNMGLFVELSLVVYTWGAIVAYLVVIGNSVNTVLEAFQVTGILGQSCVLFALLRSPAAACFVWEQAKRTWTCA